MSVEDHVLRGERRNQGLGTGATRLALDWAFNMLGVHNVILSVLPSNVGAIRAYEKAGFQRVGIRRDAVLSLGEVSDEILIDAVRHEFESPVLAARR
jgi:RimJ/RimL family protein N-acetyltransferase